MIYLLETYVGQHAAPECLVHCPLDEFDDLYKWCQKKFGEFRLTKFAEYTFDVGRVPFYDEEKNFEHTEARGVPPRPVSFEDMRNWGEASVRNLK